MEPLGFGDIVIRFLAQFLPVWISLVVLFVLSFAYKRRLGLYGKLFDSPIGMVGFALVMFWVFTDKKIADFAVGFVNHQSEDFLCF